MTKEEIIEMVRRALIEKLAKYHGIDSLYESGIFDFANEMYQLGRAHGKQFEREECAKVCEQEKDIDGISTAKAFAEIIRARGQE